MAVIAVAGLGAVVSQGATGATLFAITAATAAAGIGAAYLDQRYIYPALFGRDKPQQPNIVGIDEMTGDDGAPGHRSWGRMALVGGHVLFFEDLETVDVVQGSKKGASTSFKRRTATVGVGWTRNLISTVEQITADQKVFWRRDPNNVIWSDFRAILLTASAGTRLRLVPTSGDVQDLAQLFGTHQVVRISKMIGAPNGFWRVADVKPFGTPGDEFGSIEFTPLQGQTPSSGEPGTAADPMEIRRMDAAVIDHTPLITRGTAPNVVFVGVSHNGPNGISASTYARRIDSLFRPGQIVRLENFTGTPDFNGRYKVHNVLPLPGFPLQGPNEMAELELRGLDGQAFPSGFTSATHASAANPGRILHADEEGFIEPDAEQEIVHYLGTETQGADVDLEAVYGSGNVHGYRGLARTTVRKLNLTNWGDRVPQFSAAVRVSDSQTTLDIIRDLMREAFDGDDLRFDLSLLTPNSLLGYTRRGRQSTSTTLQPVALAYGIESQERGDVWTFFKGEDADLHQLLESEMGCHVGVRSRPTSTFQHQRLQDIDLPRRLSVYYRDPLNSFSRTEKHARASRPSEDTDEGVTVDLDPLVLYPWDAQNCAHRLYNNALVARDQGKLFLPPSRADLLPNDRLTFTALNWNEEDIEIDGGEIDHATAIGEVEPFSVSIELDFEEFGRCRLVDDGEGALVGYPDEVTASTNSVDYDTGHIEFAADDEILEARIRYEFPNAWRMRAQRVVRRVNGLIEVDAVSVAETFPVVGSPVQQNEPTFPQVIRPAILQTHVLDIPATSYWLQGDPGVLYVAAPVGGSEWRGAGVYSSLDGTSYTLRGAITRPSTVGVTLDTLATGQSDVPDWESTVTVHLAHGTLSDATLEEINSGLGINWALIGDEIVAFQTATLDDDDTYVLSGLLRGLRDTGDAMSTHATGERFVLLTSAGVEGTPESHGWFETFALPGDIGRTLWIKIVPNGGVLDDYEATEVTFRANNVRPLAPAYVTQGNFNLATYSWNVQASSCDPAAWLNEDIVVHWFRRSRSLIAAFGAGSSAPLLEPIERYQVDVLRNGDVIPARSTIIGGSNTGSPFVHRLFRYTLAEQIADGFIGGDEAIIRVRQIGLGGTNGYSRAAELAWTLP